MPTTCVNNISIYYEVHGEGEPVVLIGGLSNDITHYKSLIPRLSQRYRLIVFDNRGAGRTDKPDIPYSIEMMANDTALLLSSLKIKQAHVLGVSMGGRIAIELSLAYPDLVKSLILVSTTARGASTYRQGGFLSLMFKVPFFRLTGKYPQPRHAFDQQRAASQAYDATKRLHEIQAPTLILHGKSDKLAPYDVATEIHDRIRRSTIVSFKGGHLFLFSRTKQFVKAVVEFLERIQATTGKQDIT